MGCINALPKGRDPRTPGVVAPLAAAGCRGNRRRVVDRWLGKIDLRPCLRSSLVVLWLRWTDAKHRVLLFFHGDEKLGTCPIAITELARCCVMVPISTLAWQILQMTKVFLPLGLWASLRHHDLLALLLPGACSRVRQSLHNDLLQKNFSTYFLFPQHDQVVILFPTPRRLRKTLLVYFCQAAWFIAAGHILSTGGALSCLAVARYRGSGQFSFRSCLPSLKEPAVPTTRLFSATEMISTSCRKEIDGEFSWRNAFDGPSLRPPGEQSSVCPDATMKSELMALVGTQVRALDSRGIGGRSSAWLRVYVVRVQL